MHGPGDCIEPATETSRLTVLKVIEEDDRESEEGAQRLSGPDRQDFLFWTPYAEKQKGGFLAEKITPCPFIESCLMLINQQPWMIGYLIRLSGLDTSSLSMKDSQRSMKPVKKKRDDP